MKYLPTFTIIFKPNVGKYSSPMDPMGHEPDLFHKIEPIHFSRKMNMYISSLSRPGP